MAKKITSLSFPFYPSEWRSSNGLRLCSLAARGLWIEMLCIAFLSEKKGFLQAGGKSFSIAALAQMVGEDLDVVQKSLTELKTAGVFDRTDKGIVFSSRMVASAKLAEIRAEAGRKGGQAKHEAGIESGGQP